MILSFAMTVEEYKAGKKTCTRRFCKPLHRKRWQGQWDKKKLIHEAWDKDPRARGKLLGQFRLTCRPYEERLADMPVEDLQAEGGMCKTLEEFYALVGRKPEDTALVIRFEPVPPVGEVMHLPSWDVWEERCYTGNRASLHFVPEGEEFKGQLSGSPSLALRGSVAAPSLDVAMRIIGNVLRLKS